jgi:hypothetical protein
MSNIIAQERLSPCRKSAHPEPNVWYLSTHQKWGNVDNGYPKIVQFLKKNGNQVLPKISQDLLDVAAFLYTADKLVIRRPWVRDLHFEIPVFEKDLWDNYQNLLVKTLSRLSGDNFTFEFKKSRYYRNRNLEKKVHPKEWRVGQSIIRIVWRFFPAAWILSLDLSS